MSFPATAPNASKLPYAIRLNGWPLTSTILGYGLGLAFGLFLSVRLLISGHPSSISPLTLGLLGLAVALICGLRLWRLKDPEVELYPDPMVHPGLFTPAVLYRSDIEGVSRTYTTRSGSYFNVVALPGRGQGVTFAGRLRDDPVFAEWLSGAPDPTAIAKATDRAGVLADDRYGSTAAERATRLKWATRIVIGFSVVSAGLSVWLGFFNPPAPLALAATLACLCIAYALVAVSQGLIIVWRPKTGVRPAVVAALLPVAVLAFRGLVTVHLPTPEPLLIAATVVGGGAGLIFFQGNWVSIRRTQSSVALGVFAGLLAYGSGAYMDDLNVSHPDRSFVVTVQGKHESHGRSTSYYLELEAWGDQPAKAVSVSSSLYETVNTGDGVCIDRYPGDLKLPWFNLGLCKATPAKGPLPSSAPSP